MISYRVIVIWCRRIGPRGRVPCPGSCSQFSPDFRGARDLPPSCHAPRSNILVEPGGLKSNHQFTLALITAVKDEWPYNGWVLAYKENLHENIFKMDVREWGIPVLSVGRGGGARCGTPVLSGGTPVLSRGSPPAPGFTRVSPLLPRKGPGTRKKGFSSNLPPSPLYGRTNWKHYSYFVRGR